jgi:hypothetical protein
MGITIRWRHLGNVLKSAWPAWLALIGIFVAFIFSLWPASTPSSAVRYTGMLLQIFGLGTVAFGLGKMRRLFDQPTLVEGLLQWLNDFAKTFTPPKNVNIKADIILGSSSAYGRGRVTNTPNPGASLEERLSAIEVNLANLQTELDAEINTTRGKFKDLKEDLQDETQERGRGDQKITHMIQEVAIGGLHLESIGLLWLILGLIGTSLPEELGRLSFISGCFR